MPRKNLPPYVQRVVRGDRKPRYRAWAMLAGKRSFGPLRDDALQAHRDAIVMRGVQDVPSWGGTFQARSDEWLAAIGERVTVDTIDFYRRKLSAVRRTVPGSMPIDRITPAVLRQFVLEARQHKLSPRSIQHCRRVLSNFLGWCLKRGYVQANPVAAVDWPKAEDTPPDVLTEDELAAALARITDPWAADLSVAMAYTGLRRAEFARLRIVDISLGEQEAVLWVRGKSRSQAHPIPADGVTAFRRLVAAAGSDEFLVPGHNDRSRRNRIAETFRVWQRKLGDSRWHAHTLRHSVCTIMLRRGEQPAIAQRFLRHASYATTQRYVHLVEGDLREATSRSLRLLKREEKSDHG